MKRIVSATILSLLLLLVACNKPTEPGTTASAEPEANVFISADPNGSNIVAGTYLVMGQHNELPVVWRVVADHSDHADSSGNALGLLLLSDMAVEYRAFNGAGATATDEPTNNDRLSFGSNNWSFSTMRQWLNSSELQISWNGAAPSEGSVLSNPYDTDKGFLADFLTEERAALLTVTHRSILAEIDIMMAAEGNELFSLPEDGGYRSNHESAYALDTTEQVFLLDVSQLADILEIDGMDEILFTGSPWWLRTPLATTSNYTLCANPDGSVLGTVVMNGGPGVRPAVYIDASSIKSGSGTATDPYRLS